MNIDYGRSNQEDRAGFTGAGPMQSHSLKGSTLALKLCYCCLDILNNVFNEGPHLFILHGAQEGRLPVLCAESGI